LSFVLPGSAQAAGPLPTGGHFVAGTGCINGTTSSLTIRQTSSKGVIDWTGFSIGSGNRVSIMNGNGATLNRVTGTDQSSILGTLSATGSVYLINPQGVVIGNSGVVSTGGRFVASTLDVDNAAFMNGGPLTFSGYLNSSVVNLGKISSSGGDVFLIAFGNVDNFGTISAPKGSAELVVGSGVLLQDSSTTRQLFVQPGNASQGTVHNGGAIEAAQISLQAADGNIFALAGNHAVLRAIGTSKRDGHVWLVADTGTAVDGTGIVWIAGSIEARNADGSGGTVDTSAANFIFPDDPNAKPFVKAHRWNITAPNFAIGGTAAPAFTRSLDNGTSINLQTTGAGVTNGYIHVVSNIQWFGSASLILGAYSSVIIEANLKNTGSGNLTMRADSTAIDNGGSVTNNGIVDWSASKGSVSAFYDMNGSYTPGKLLANASWTSPAFSGLVKQITGYKLVNSLTDLKNVSIDLAGNYALGTDINASAMSTPIGSNKTPFTGQFDGQGHAINSLRMLVLSNGSPVQVGLFGTLGASAVVRNLGVSGAMGIGGNAMSEGGILYGAQGEEGLLAADNYGTILRVNTSGNLIFPQGFGDYTTGGGLVGVNHGTIERSSSSVNARTGGTLGGLVGENDGVIIQSYASGKMSGFEIATKTAYTQGAPGGLVGTNNGTIAESYATGAVTNTCPLEACSAGGLVNTNHGTIRQSFATGAVTINGPSSLAEQGHYGGIAAYNSGTIANDVYWNKDTTGAIAGVGTGTSPPASNGLTRVQMSKPASFSGWNFSSTGVWALPTGTSHPILRWQLDPPVIN
jgi:filamentous hemagglutinin family protein